MQRLLARQFMYAKVGKGDALCFYQNVIGASRNCDWFIVVISGTLAVYAEKAQVKSFVKEGEEGQENESESDVEGEEPQVDEDR